MNSFRVRVIENGWILTYSRSSEIVEISAYFPTLKDLTEYVLKQCAEFIYH